ncbi:MAG: hypothetical protein ABL871_19435, partial [Terricaulis sp.]
AAAQAAIERDPLSPTPFAKLARALLRVGRSQEAGRIYEQMNARWPDAWWDVWALYSVRYGISDSDVVLRAAPPRVSEDMKTCWRQLATAYASSSRALRRAGADTARRCEADGRISSNTAELMQIGLLGDVDAFFTRYGAFLDRRSPSGFLFYAGEIFNPTERDLRADPRFLSLMRESGIYQYWRDTGTHPDTCDLPQERNFEVCASLRADQSRDSGR